MKGKRMNKAIFLDRDGTLNIDPQQSIMVGDKIEDIKAGINAKVKINVLVRTGKPVTKEGERLANAVLDSIVDLPDVIKALVSNSDCAFFNQ